MIPETTLNTHPLKVVSRAANHSNAGVPAQSASVIALPFLQHIPFNALVAASIFSQLGLSSYCPANYLKYMVQRCDEQRLKQELDKITGITETVSFNTAGEIVCNNVAEYPAELCRDACTLEDITAVSKIGDECVYMAVYNASFTTPKEFFIKIACNQPLIKSMNVLYGFDRCGVIPVSKYIRGNHHFYYVKLYLKPLHLVILKN